MGISCFGIRSDGAKYLRTVPRTGSSSYLYSYPSGNAITTGTEGMMPGEEYAITSSLDFVQDVNITFATVFIYFATNL